jgi:hypothetical protein
MSDYNDKNFDTYHALANEKRAKEIAHTDSPYHIEVRFLGGLTPSQMDIFKAAADRWTRIIVGDLPDVIVAGEHVDDLVIDAQGVPIDGPGRILGQAGPRFVRPPNAGRHAWLTAKGMMQFDTADLKVMEERGILNDVITHEMGHVIGMIGTIWSNKGLVVDQGLPTWAFTGPGAMREYGALVASSLPTRPAAGGLPKPVPIENTGGPGTAGSHWRETVFGNELMTGFVSQAGGNPLSCVTAACLGDIGYDVDLDAADDYQLPSYLELGELGLLASLAGPIEALGAVLPTIPIVLSEQSLV